MYYLLGLFRSELHSFLTWHCIGEITVTNHKLAKRTIMCCECNKIFYEDTYNYKEK